VGACDWFSEIFFVAVAFPAVWAFFVVWGRFRALLAAMGRRRIVVAAAAGQWVLYFKD